jgi:hypothetical protein
LAGLALALSLTGPTLPAQEDRDKDAVVWRLEGLRSAMCVQLLVDPSIVKGELPSEFRLLGASQSEDLHPALRTVVENQPDAGSWAPSSFCLYYLDAIDAGAVRVQTKNQEKITMLGVWTVGAIELSSGSRRDVALELLTNSGRLQQVGGSNGLRLREVSSSVGKVPEALEDTTNALDDDRYRLKVGKTVIIWDGHPVADSTKVNEAVSWSWVLGSTGAEAKVTLEGPWRRSLVGSLRIEGKDAFARALKTSPTRFVGPLYHGGEGELAFSR